jgi:hypothetical protein
VNPEVPHPRWSQATERRIGDGGLLAPKRKTLLFNGYGDQVAGLYAGMDLKRISDGTHCSVRGESGWHAALQRALLSRAAKPVVWGLWLLPLAWLVWGVLADSLGANPAEALIRGTGDWALRAVLAWR